MPSWDELRRPSFFSILRQALMSQVIDLGAFYDELDHSFRNGTRSYGPSDSVFFLGRNGLGTAHPSAAGRSRPPGHSRPEHKLCTDCTHS
jgi:hypothetical protein